MAALFWETSCSRPGGFWTTKWSQAFASICGRGKFSELLVQCKYSVRGFEHDREGGDISFKKALDTISHLVQAREENSTQLKLGSRNRDKIVLEGSY